MQKYILYFIIKYRLCSIHMAFNAKNEQKNTAKRIKSLVISVLWTEKNASTAVQQIDELI
jgi:hypothetical protein